MIAAFKINVGMPVGYLAKADSLLWYLYLALLILVSFWPDSFLTPFWAGVASAVFALLAAHCASVALGAGCNSHAWFTARFAYSLLGCTLLLLLLQLVLPVSNSLHQALSISVNDEVISPEWYRPALVWSVVPESTKLLLLSELIMFAVFLLTLSMVCTRKRVFQLLVVILCVGLVHAGVGVLTKFSGALLVDPNQVDGHFTVARAWFINRNHFAAFVSLTMVGSLALLIMHMYARVHKGLTEKVLDNLLGRQALVWFALIMGVLAIVLSQSRAGFFGLILASILASFFMRKSAGHFGQVRGAVLPILIVGVLVGAYFGNDLLSRFSNEGTLLGERLEQWRITWQAIAKEWLLGYGGNSYAVVFQAERADQGLRQVIYDQSHNDYLHIWLEQGLLGLSLWGALLLLTLVQAKAVFVASTSKLTSASMLAIIIVVVAALLQSFFDFNLHILSIRYYFFVIIALPFAIPTIRHGRGRKTRPRQ